MKLGSFLFRVTENSIIKLYAENKFVLSGEIRHFFRDFDNPEDDNYDNYIEPYTDWHIRFFEWTDEGLIINISQTEKGE